MTGGFSPVRIALDLNVSCALGDWLTPRPGGCSQPGELWFTDTLTEIITFQRWGWGHFTTTVDKCILTAIVDLIL